MEANRKGSEGLVARYTNLIRLVKNWHRFIAWKSKLLPGDEFLVKLRNGYEFPLDRYSVAEFKTIFVRMDYVADMERWKRTQGCILDIGANVGLFSVFAAACLPGRAVFAYEPFPRNFQVLKKNLERNGIPNAAAFPDAVGGASGEAVFGTHTDRDHPTHASLQSAEEADGEHYFRVPVRSLEEVFEQHGIDRCAVLKIDVEGAEFDVLRNAPQAVLEKVANIAVEVDEIGESGHDVDSMLALLRERGFEAVRQADNMVCAWR